MEPRLNRSRGESATRLRLADLSGQENTAIHQVLLAARSSNTGMGDTDRFVRIEWAPGLGSPIDGASSDDREE